MTPGCEGASALRVVILAAEYQRMSNRTAGIQETALSAISW